MNRDEAKKILRLHGLHLAECPDVEVREAVEAANSDPILAAWLERELEFERSVAAGLETVQPPAALREKSLSGARALPDAPRRMWWAIGTLAACAVLVFTVFRSREELAPPNRLAPWQSVSLETLSSVLSGGAKLDVESQDAAKLRAWLAAEHGPDPSGLPNGLLSRSTVGCKLLVVDHQPVSIICFHLDGNQLVHLVTVGKKELPNPPPERQPRFVQQGEWVTASWSDRGQSFMLAMRSGSEADLRRLLMSTG